LQQSNATDVVNIEPFLLFRVRTTIYSFPVLQRMPLPHRGKMMGFEAGLIFLACLASNPNQLS